VSTDLPIEVDLQELPGGCFIIAHKTGVSYSHQCGGLACTQNTIEGFLVPCSHSNEVNEQLYRHFYEGPKYKGHCYSGLDEDDAMVLDLVLASMGLACLSVDRQRLRNSIEAWVHLKVDSGLPCVPYCYNSDPASSVVMIWENSD
jgi:hypothetical protein